MPANFGAQGAAPGGGRTVSSATLAGQPAPQQGAPSEEQISLAKGLMAQGYSSEQIVQMLQQAATGMRTPEQIRGAWKPEGKSIPEYRKDTLGGELGSKAMTTETVAMSPEVVEQAAKNTNTVLESMQSWRDLKKSGDDIDKAMGAVAKYPVRGDPLVAPAVVDMWMNMHDTRGRFTDTTTASDAHKQMQEASFTQKDKVEVLNKLIQHKRGVMDRMAQMSSDVAGRQYRDKITQTDTAKVKGGTEGVIGKGSGGSGSDASTKPGYVSPREKLDEAEDKRLWNEVADLGEKSQIKEATSTREKLNIIAPIIQKYKDIPGWGSDFYNRLLKAPGMMKEIVAKMPFAKNLTKQQLADVTTLSNTLGRLNVEYLRAISGKAATDTERKLIAKLAGDSPFTSDAELREALAALTREIATSVEATSLNYRPIVRQTFWDQRDWNIEGLRGIKFAYTPNQPSTNAGGGRILAPTSAKDIMDDPDLQDLINRPTNKE